MGVSDPQLMLGAQRKEKVPIAVGIAYSVFAQNRHPRVVVTANSSIKVTHQALTLGLWVQWPGGPVDLKTYWPPKKLTGPGGQ